MSSLSNNKESFGTLLGYAPGGVAIYSSDYETLDSNLTLMMPHFAVILVMNIWDINGNVSNLLGDFYF